MSKLYKLIQKIHQNLEKVCEKYNLEKIEIESDYYFDFNYSYEYDKNFNPINHQLYSVYYFSKCYECGESNQVFYDETKKPKKHPKQNGLPTTSKLYPAIDPPQIRQILQAFEGVLGDNPEYIKKFEELTDIANELGFDECPKCGTNIFHQTEEKNYSQALCQKWLDGLNPMFDSEPEKVLEELNEILENLIK